MPPQAFFMTEMSSFQLERTRPYERIKLAPVPFGAISKVDEEGSLSKIRRMLPRVSLNVLCTVKMAGNCSTESVQSRIFYYTHF